MAIGLLNLIFFLLNINYDEKEKAGSDGSCPVEKAKAVSGEKLLRNIMLDSKIELYGPYVSSGAL